MNASGGPPLKRSARDKFGEICAVLFSPFSSAAALLFFLARTGLRNCDDRSCPKIGDCDCRPPPFAVLLLWRSVVLRALVLFAVAPFSGTAVAASAPVLLPLPLTLTPPPGFALSSFSLPLVLLPVVDDSFVINRYDIRSIGSAPSTVTHSWPIAPSTVIRIEGSGAMKRRRRSRSCGELSNAADGIRGGEYFAVIKPSIPSESVNGAAPKTMMKRVAPTE